jgi:glutathione S-transferase
MKLYFSPGACSLASHIALNEVGTAFETEKVSTKDKAAMKAIHAKGYVPMLKMDNGEILTEGVAILQYVADQKPELNLMPKFGTTERYRAQEWLNFIATEIHKGCFAPLFGAEGLVVDTTARTAFTTVVKENLTKKFDYIESQLTGREFLMGKNFTVCDAYLFTCFSWSNYVGFETAGKWPNISAWNSRVYARPAVQKAMQTEGLLK